MNAERKVGIVTFGSVYLPRGGLAVRSRAVVEALIDIGITPFVISTEEPATEGVLDAVEVSVLKRPLRWGWSLELVRKVKWISRNVDVIIVESAMLIPAVVHSKPRIPIVWDTNECETLHYHRLEGNLRKCLKGAIWYNLERWSARRCQVVVAISDEEAKWWKHFFPAWEKRVVVVNHRPIIDTAPSTANATLFRRVPGKVILLFVGSMDGKHNAVAAEWLLKVLAPALPTECILVLAGKGTGKLTLPYSTRADIRCLGEVEHIDAVIAMADYCLAPLSSGAGVKTKVLHYLAHGKCVIGTPLAFEGLEGAPGLFSAELQEWCAFMPEIMKQVENDGDRRSRQGRQREWLEARHGRQVIAEQWRSVLGRIM
ncbi:MAG: glycosyltransferase family 4 protein [Thermaerobacter sp.]|nr:glycosyltransferase family 4 protein [Thermaerobacter sp.]